jgi:hypothetical protein
LTIAAPNASVELPAKAAMILLHSKLLKLWAVAPHIYDAHSNPLANTKIGRLPKSTSTQLVYTFPAQTQGYIQFANGTQKKFNAPKTRIGYNSKCDVSAIDLSNSILRI